MDRVVPPLFPEGGASGTVVRDKFVVLEVKKREILGSQFLLPTIMIIIISF